MKPPIPRKAIIRAFDLILTFDSELSDNELENEVIRLMDEINIHLKNSFRGSIPQLSYDDHKGKKKIKIGITPISNELEEE